MLSMQKRIFLLAFTMLLIKFESTIISTNSELLLNAEYKILYSPKI